MAKGTEEKQSVINKILETFEGSFIYNGGKEIRIPLNDVQIKCTLTCAKDNVSPDAETAIPGEPTPSAPVSVVENVETKEESISLTDEEKDNLAVMIQNLGL